MLTRMPNADTNKNFERNTKSSINGKRRYTAATRCTYNMAAARRAADYCSGGRLIAAWSRG